MIFLVDTIITIINLTQVFQPIYSYAYSMTANDYIIFIIESTKSVFSAQV